MDSLWAKLETQFYLFTQKWGLINEPTKESWEEYNFSIHNLEEQNFIKRLWSICAVEELAEFMEAFEDGEDHIKEEACDFFNFLMSGFIALGYNWRDLKDSFNPIYMKFFDWPDFVQPMELWRITEKIHLAMNKLKNRPWTDSNFKVDMLVFTKRVKDVWVFGWRFIQDVFKDWNDFEDHFNKKIATNIHRIKTGY